MERNERGLVDVSAAMRILAVLLGMLVLAGLVACGGAPVLPGAQGVRPVVTIEFHGGMCADGGECRHAMIIRNDGTIIDPAQPMVTATADPGHYARMLSAIAATDLLAMKARPFTGTCPVAFDGQEVIFTFRLPAGDVRLASCESELDPDHELFRAIAEVLRAAEGPSN
jgi:hypothetical protein